MNIHCRLYTLDERESLRPAPISDVTKGAIRVKLQPSGSL